MEITKVRIVWKGTESDFICLWRELIDRGHQRFKVEEIGIKDCFWIDLLLPELLKYGVPIKWIRLDNCDSYLWPWPTGALSALRPIFRGCLVPTMFLNVNYYGIYYDHRQSKFRACKPYSENIDDSHKFRHASILQSLGIPLDVFLDYPEIWPIDLDWSENKHEYYFQKTSEV